MTTILDYVNENKGFFNEVLAQLMRVLLFYHVSEKHHVETFLAFCCEIYFTYAFILSSHFWVNYRSPLRNLAFST